MRHRVKGKKLNRDVKHRRALHKNLITALITHGQIKTTEAKAKSIRSQVDKLMTKAKKGSLHDRRQINSVLNRSKIVNTLVDQIAPKTKRTSGFTRIVRLGRRSGDDTMMVKLEFVDSVISAPVKEKDSNKKPDSKPSSKSAKTKKQSKKKVSDKSKKTTDAKKLTTKSKEK